MKLTILWKKLTESKLGIKYTVLEKITYWGGCALMIWGAIVLMTHNGQYREEFLGTGLAYLGLMFLSLTMLEAYGRRIKELQKQQQDSTNKQS